MSQVLPWSSTVAEHGRVAGGDAVWVTHDEWHASGTERWKMWMNVFWLRCSDFWPSGQGHSILPQSREPLGPCVHLIQHENPHRSRSRSVQVGRDL